MQRAAVGAAVPMAGAAVVAVGASSAGSGGRARLAGLTAPEADAPVPSLGRQGRGPAEPDRLGGLRPARVGEAVREATGCQVNAKYAGSSSEMVSLMANGGGGQYDLVSASGDADLRLIYGGDVQADQHQPDPVVEAVPPVPAVAAVQHDRRQALRRLLRVRPERAALLDQGVQDRADVLVGALQQEVRGPDHGAGQPDPDRRRGAVPVEVASPSLGITDPYELTQTQFNAAVALLKAEHPLIKKYWDLASQEISLFQSRTTVVGAAWPYQTNTLKADARAGRRHDPEPGGDRLGRHLDARDQRAAPELRLQVDAVGVDAEGPGRGGDLLRRDAGQHAGLPDHEQDRRRARARPTTPTRRSRTSRRSSSGRRRSRSATTARTTACRSRTGSRPGRRSRRDGRRMVCDR